MTPFPVSVRHWTTYLLCFGLFAAQEVRGDENAPAPANNLVGDSLGLSKGRTDGAPLKGAVSETGQGQWNATDELVFSAKGGVTANVAHPGMAILPINPSLAKILRVQADVNPDGSGFAGIVLLADNDMAGFWKRGALWAYLGPGGNWGVYSNGSANVLGKGSGEKCGFRPSDFNHLELLYNPTSQQVSLIINGVSVVKDVPVVTPPSGIAQAGIRFNEPVTANLPLIKNFAVNELDKEP